MIADSQQHVRRFAQPISPERRQNHRNDAPMSGMRWRVGVRGTVGMGRRRRRFDGAWSGESWSLTSEGALARARYIEIVEEVISDVYSFLYIPGSSEQQDKLRSWLVHVAEPIWGPEAQTYEFVKRLRIVHIEINSRIVRAAGGSGRRYYDQSTSSSQSTERKPRWANSDPDRWKHPTPSQNCGRNPERSCRKRTRPLGCSIRRGLGRSRTW